MTRQDAEQSLTEEEKFKILMYCRNQELKPLYINDFMLVCENKLGSKIWVDLKGVVAEMTNADKYLKDGVIDDFVCAFDDFCAMQTSNQASGVRLAQFLSRTIKPTLTEDERVILRNIDPKYEFIGKNDKNFLYIRISADNGNFAERLTGLDFVFPNLFQFIKNGEEYLIEELLK